MIFEQIATGGDRNFAYLIGDSTTGKAALADPSNDPELVIKTAKEHGLKVSYLINTHGHYDHADGNNAVLSATKAELVTSSTTKDGQELSLGKVKLKIIHTPGHTTDSMCVLAVEEGDVPRLVTGDTLFVGKVGGTGYGEDAKQEYDSLHNKLMALPDETEVWPGHNYGAAPSSTIGNERETNPFLLRDSFDSFVDLKKNWAAYKKEHGIK